MMLDFAAIKANAPIQDVALTLLRFECTKEGDTLRAPCPQCAPRNPRAIIITPEKNLYYCFTKKGGGDVISLVAHVQGTSQRKAAELLAQLYLHKEERKADTAGPLQPLDYLDAEHHLVNEIGFSRDVCEAVGIGYASKGLMRTHVAIPIRTPTGELVGYIGIKEAKLPPRWRV